jgi:hypothetical protein
MGVRRSSAIWVSVTVHRLVGFLTAKLVIAKSGKSLPAVLLLPYIKLGQVQAQIELQLMIARLHVRA